MRIIAGEFGGRRFNPPAKNWPTRPTTDISKEGLFNILQNMIDFEEIEMLDLFGGTGNHCYEFISRGCENATYVDKHGPAVRFVERIKKEWEIGSRLNIVKMDVFKYISSCKKSYTYIFAGPPYPLPNLDEIPDIIFKNDILALNGLFVLEHNPNHNFEAHPNYFKSRKYGQTIFSFFEHAKETEE